MLNMFFPFRYKAFEMSSLLKSTKHMLGSPWKRVTTKSSISAKPS